MLEENSQWKQPPVRWHLIYYALAIFDILTIAASLYLSDQILDIHTHSIRINQDWSKRLSLYDEIGQKGIAVNAPGNDVFDSGDVPGERAKRNLAYKEYETLLDRATSDVQNIEDPENREQITASLERIRESMISMVNEADLIFALFETNQREKAGSRMATMDRKLHNLTTATYDLRQYVLEVQRRNLEREEASAKDMSRFESIIFAAILFIVVLVSLYGHYVAKKVSESHRIITQQQTQLLENNKLAALGVMAGGIAHEINNPLSVMVGYGSQIERLVAKDRLSEEKALKIASSILKTGGRIRAIINGLKVFSRDETNDPFERKNIKDLITEIVSICEPRIQQKNIELQIDPESAEFDFDCHPTAIEQVIINFLNNSVDAISETSNPWISIKYKINDSNAIISVADSGALIPSKIINEIFTPFFTTKAVGSGTGLGLSISRGLAKNHGGTIRFSQESGRNEFILEIPRYQAAPIKPTFLKEAA